MPPVFLDTGYIVALQLDRDQYHASALSHWNQLLSSDLNFVTMSYVLDEVVTFLASDGYHGKAVSVGNTLLESSAIQMIHVDEPLLLEAWRYFQRHDDKRYSLTDCISFVIMTNLGIQTAYSFDRNFVQAGFIIEPT